MIDIGDTAVSEQQVVDTTAMSSPKNEEKAEAEKKSTSTKKSKPYQKRNLPNLKVRANSCLFLVVWKIATVICLTSLKKFWTCQKLPCLNGLRKTIKIL